MCASVVAMIYFLILIRCLDAVVLSAVEVLVTVTKAAKNRGGKKGC